MGLFVFILIVGIIMLIAKHWQIILIFFVGCILIAIAVSISQSRARKREQEKFEEIEASFDEVDKMDGHRFEYFVASVLKKNGFSNVVVTKASGDYGVDITATKDKMRWAFQCKCYQSTLGLKPIQEVYAGAEKYNAGKAVVVTNSHFSKNARTLAEELGVLLWDRNVLGKMMIKNKNTVEPPKIEPVSTHTPAAQKQAEQSAKIAQPINNKKVEDIEMATIIGAGKYVFGEDFPMGKFDLKAVSGSGMLMIQTAKANGEDEIEEKWQNMGVGEKNFSETYRGLSLPNGWYFAIDGDLQVEISRTKMLEID